MTFMDELLRSRIEDSRREERALDVRLARPPEPSSDPRAALAALSERAQLFRRKTELLLDRAALWSILERYKRMDPRPDREHGPIPRESSAPGLNAPARPSAS